LVVLHVGRQRYRAMTRDRLKTVLRGLAVGAFLVIGGRCAYLEHKLAVVTSAADTAKGEVRANEHAARVGPRVSNEGESAAAHNGTEEGSRNVRQEVDDAASRIDRVGPRFSTVSPPVPPAPIRQTAPGVFTNRDTDPAETPSRERPDSSGLSR